MENYNKAKDKICEKTSKKLKMNDLNYLSKND